MTSDGINFVLLHCFVLLLQGEKKSHNIGTFSTSISFLIHILHSFTNIRHSKYTWLNFYKSNGMTTFSTSDECKGLKFSY
jgi:hypothetical protein